MPSNLLRSIFASEQRGSRDMRGAGCFPLHVAEMKPLFLRNKQLCTMVARNQYSIQKRSHVLVLLQMDGFRKIQRNMKRLYLVSIHSMSPNAFSILPDPGKHVRVESVIKSAMKNRFNSPWCSLHLDRHVNDLQQLMVFAIVAFARERGVCCVLKRDAPFEVVSMSFRVGLRGDRAVPITFFFTTNC